MPLPSRDRSLPLVARCFGLVGLGLPELRAAEAEVAREWRWLHDALNEIARVRAEQGDAAAFRLMQAQAMRVQRRIELSMRIAELERIG